MGIGLGQPKFFRHKYLTLGFQAPGRYFWVVNDMAPGAGGRDIVARGARGEGRPGELGGGGVVALLFS